MCNNCGFLRTSMKLGRVIDHDHIGVFLDMEPPRI